MIKSSILPTIRCVASSAILTKFALMSIVFNMTGIAIRRGVLVALVYMAILAVNLKVLTGKGKTRLAVIKNGMLPA